MRDYISTGDTNMLDEIAVLVKAAAHKAMKITNELLILSTISQQEIAGKKLDMKRIFSGAKIQAEDAIKKNNATITEPEVWPVSLGYDAWVEEVWVNFLTNAIKYGGTPPKIEVGAEHEGDKIKFWIQDNGIGISPQNQKKLFKKYARFAPEKADGYGLGLSIVKRIVEKLNGTVGVESTGENGKGSRFWFTLPASFSLSNAIKSPLD
jgi:signal transduction histidine kinase